MTQKILAIVGLSGVGKTTALRALGGTQQFQHLTASAVIQHEREVSDPDSLRNWDIEDNQRLLLDGFRRSVDPQAQCVVLDGHTIVETPSGIVPIPSDVFRDLQISSMIFLTDDPATIAQRRSLDLSRKRPLIDVSTIESNQRVALLAAYEISLTLRIPLTVIVPEHSSILERLIQLN